MPQRDELNETVRDKSNQQQLGRKKRRHITAITFIIIIIAKTSAFSVVHSSYHYSHLERGDILFGKSVVRQLKEMKQKK
jgi:hypothetical protein